jgi:hypothetical protein
MGLGLGLAGLAVGFLPADPNVTLAKWLLIGAAVLIVVGLVILFWPQRMEQPTATATQSGSRNVQIQGQTVNFQGTISTGEGEVSTGQLSDGRVLVDVTPQYLTDFFREHTDIQAKKLLEAFIGKWMRVSGPVGDVYANDESNATVYFNPPTYGRTRVLMYFNDKATIDDRLRVLKKGDRVTVVG